MNSHQAEVTQPVAELKCLQVLDPTAPTLLGDEVCGLKGVRLEINRALWPDARPGAGHTKCSGDLTREGVE